MQFIIDKCIIFGDYMRILLIHSDYLKYKAKNKTKIAEDIPEEMQEGFFEDTLVVFTAVEKADEENPEQLIKNVVDEIISVNDDVSAKTIVIYPYAHLSFSLSSPKVAKEILLGMEETLKRKGFNVGRAPFGWYKSFEISCKGHPLSELSRSINSDAPVDEEESESVDSKFFIIENNDILEVDDFKFSDDDLKKLVDSELGISKSSGKEPPHVKLMKEKELADYEIAADVGHLRWYPKGRIVRDLIADYVYDLAIENGAMPIETPIMYDLSNQAIFEHADKFGERQYRLTDNKKELMLRFACCFGAFRVLSDSFLTWKNLPAKVYELSTYSFRKEKKGEVVGLKRLRAFTMPDMHSICADIPQSLEAFQSQVEMCLKTSTDFDVNYEIIFRATQDFFDDNKEWMIETANLVGKPLLLEIIPERKHYWICKMDFAAIDYLGRPIENPTVQIDVESGKRFDINYLDENEENKHPIVIHCSPTGSVERVICSLLEKTAIELNEKQPMLPIWLSPTQVRVIPIAERHYDYALDIVKKLTDENIRADIDDNTDTVGKKVRNASKEWIPYTLVIGDNELNSDTFNISVRSSNEKVDMTIDTLINNIKNETKGMPIRKIPLPINLSKRISFK